MRNSKGASAMIASVSLVWIFADSHENDMI
jgi:hypothetical protein